MSENKVNIPIPVNITKEKVKGKDVFIAESPLFPVASQGHSIEEAKKHLEEALRSYWKHPKSKKILRYSEIVFEGNMFMDVPKKAIEYGKASDSIRA